MKKDAYYFPHFSNARTDSKILKLRRVMGIEGYGIYFMLLEVLREQTDFKLPISSVEDLEFEFRISKEKIAAVINNFDLFQIDNQMFFSPKLMFYLQPYLEKTERAREAANKRWLKSVDANAYANASANAMQGKERKGKESKGKKNKNTLSDAAASDWQLWVDEWFGFYERMVGSKPLFAGAEAKALKTIHGHLKDIEVWRYILSNWHYQDDWIRDKLELKLISSKINSILVNAKKSIDDTNFRGTKNNQYAAFGQFIESL